jgi:membrane-bound lytic murein transglycosylase D
MHTPIRLLTVVVATASLSAACASRAASPTTHVTPEPASHVSTPVDAPAAVDPVRELLASSDRLFEDGRHQLSLGHLAQAKSAFNAALELLLASPDATRADARVRQHLDRLVDRIAALELTALATGDGFTEQAAEPASIDQLLAISTFDTAPPTAATTENVEADLRETTHDLPIPLNDRVLRYVELFQGRLRDFLTEGLARGAQYLPMIQSVFRAEGLPLDLAYVPLIESAFKPTALSRAKARGVWQFMRGTGLENGLQQDWYIDERSDPEKATVAAAKYFKTLYRMFDDWHLAMASYNGGPGRMQRAIKASRRNDFWSLTATSRYLPRETREYVPMILAAVIIAKNPAKYGFDVPPPAAPATETVEVPAAVDLRRVAEWASVPVEEIQRLNPELRRWTTPIRGDDYALTVPAGNCRDNPRRARHREPEHAQRPAVVRRQTRRNVDHHRPQAAGQSHRPGGSQLSAGGLAGEGRAEAADSADAVGGAAGARGSRDAGSNRGERCGRGGLRGVVHRNGGASRAARRHAVWHRAQIPDDG